MPADTPGPGLGILLIAGDLARAHTAMVMAASAASLDRPVALFATQGGLNALCRDWSGLSGSADDRVFQSRGVAGFETLRGVLVPLGVRLLACDSGLRAMAILPDALLDGVEIAGVPSFLGLVGNGQLLSI